MPCEWALPLLVEFRKTVVDIGVESDDEDVGACIKKLHRSASVVCLDECMNTAHTAMARAVDARRRLLWRRIYTDAAIELSLLRLGSATELNDADAFACVFVLDHAIVIAGAPGPGRLLLIHDLIKRIQHEFLPTKDYASASRSITSPTISYPDMHAEPAVLSSAGSHIPYLKRPPSLSHFRNLACHEPFVLPRFALEWPALSQQHSWASPTYLKSVAGRGRVVPVEVGSDYRTDDWTQKMMSWDELIDVLYSPSCSGGSPAVSNPVLYLAQHSLFMQLPELRDDIAIPDYVYAYPAPPSDFPDYSPPANDEELVINAWLGPAGTISPAHTDPYFNLYTQVVGRKTIWLASPSASTHMYAYGSPDQPSTHSHNPAANSLAPSLSNTSQVNVFAEHGSRELSDGAHPSFWQHVAPHAMSVTLEPGDMLSIPPGWWHAMRSEQTSFSVSMWF